MHFFEALEPRELLSGRTPSMSVSATQMVFSQPQGTTSAAQYLTLKNTGRVSISINSFTTVGGDHFRFAANAKYTAKTLAPGQSTSVRVYFTPLDLKVASTTLQIGTSVSKTPFSVSLRGIGALGFFEPGEPSLQWIMDAYQIPIHVGDTNPATSHMDAGGASDEVPIQLLQPASSGPVRISLLSTFSWATNPVVNAGWYEGTTGVLHQQFTVLAGSAQSTNPSFSGTFKWYPTTPFGLYTSWPGQVHGAVYSQDSRNTWDTTDNDQDHGHKVKFFPYKDAKGNVVANAYVVAFEESFNDDFQDLVYLITNVKPA
jgi:hypothetical protein